VRRGAVLFYLWLYQEDEMLTVEASGPTDATIRPVAFPLHIEPPIAANDHPPVEVNLDPLLKQLQDKTACSGLSLTRVIRG